MPEQEISLNFLIEAAYDSIPGPCRECNFAKLIVALEVMDSERHNILDTINGIKTWCSGYEGPDESSEMYSPGADRSGCPYALISAEVNEFKKSL